MKSLQNIVAAPRQGAALFYWSRSAAPCRDAATVDGILTIARPFMAGFTVRECSKSRPSGTKEMFCRHYPAGSSFFMIPLDILFPVQGQLIGLNSAFRLKLPPNQTGSVTNPV